MKIPAITLHQPFAQLLVLGQKHNETRDWETDYRGPLAIHAGKSQEGLIHCIEEPFRSVLEAAGYTQATELPLGAVVGLVTIVDCVSTNDMPHPVSEQEAAFGNYEPDRFVWITKDAVRVDPIPARGYQKIWEWADPPHSFRCLFDGKPIPNQTYWVTATGGHSLLTAQRRNQGVCVFATTEQEARKRAADAGMLVNSVHRIPYPAEPQLNPADNTSGCPPFCYTPTECLGRSSCPHGPACSE